ncbi:hypothetical protein M0804_011998 [Polistes exclamans]|nr:hypothetical protein M0804_011998 [Polistes exclamans]
MENLCNSKNEQPVSKSDCQQLVKRDDHNASLQCKPLALKLKYLLVHVTSLLCSQRVCRSSPIALDYKSRSSQQIVRRNELRLSKDTTVMGSLTRTKPDGAMASARPSIKLAPISYET